MTNPVFKNYQQKERKLAEILGRISEANVWRRLRLSEHGDLIEGHLLAKINACYLQFATGQFDLAGFLALQAETKTYIAMLNAGKKSDDKIADWERQAEGLQKDLKRLQTTGLDRDLSSEAQSTQGTS